MTCQSMFKIQNCSLSELHSEQLQALASNLVFGSLLRRSMAIDLSPINTGVGIRIHI